MPASRESRNTATTRKRKVRTEHAPYQPRAPQQKVNKNAPKTSAQPILPKKRAKLTNHDWMTIYAYVDAHPGTPQEKIVDHFRNRTEGRLIFDQSTLSRKLKVRAEIENRSMSYPNGLSQKRVRIVTRPDVDSALFYWVKAMEAKRESVTGAMLVAKRAKFEERFNVPQEERLGGEGWIPSFKKAYNIKEYRRHGEAASVDLDAVEAERVRVRAILARYREKDHFNFDETSFFAL